MRVFPFARCPPQVRGDCLRCPMRGRAVVYGPFRSRRRGLSIGVNLFIGAKVCSFDCVYCFRGATAVKRRRPYDPGLPTIEMLEEGLRRALGEVGDVEAVDFSGSGEPTLHSRLGEFIRAARRVVGEYAPGASLGIFTNSSTLGLRRVVEALKELDQVEAKLDTLDERKFQVINRPVEGIRVGDILEALKSFRREYGGTLAVQVMLVSYGGCLNYTLEDAERMAEALTAVDPDEVHLYTAYRAPRLPSVARAPPEEIVEFARVLRSSGLRVEVYPE